MGLATGRGFVFFRFVSLKCILHPSSSLKPHALTSSLSQISAGFMSDHSDTHTLDKYGGRSVHISKVEELVSTGDIIMFKSRNSLSGLQRIATGTNWDHVGMVLKRGKTLCDILEATGDGVHMYPLAQRLEVYSRTLMSEICVRQLQGNISVNLTKMLKIFSIRSRVNHMN